MPKLTQSLAAWNTSAFSATLQQELEQLDPHLLPLQQGLKMSSYLLDRPIQVMIISSEQQQSQIVAKVGIFYKGMLAGCNCSDDPSPVDEVMEHCEVWVNIDLVTGECHFDLHRD